MKRLFTILLSLVMVIACFGMVACGGGGTSSSSSKQSESSISESSQQSSESSSVESSSVSTSIETSSTASSSSTASVSSSVTPMPAEKLSVSAPDGAPIMAISYMMKTDNSYDYSVVAGTDIPVIFTQAQEDFVIAPTNAGMKLSILQDKYKVIATTSWGNLYLVGTGEAKAFSECATVDEFLSQFNGEDVTSIGTNQVPDVSFKHLLTEKSISCTVNASTDAPTIIASLKTGDIEYGILGEPAVTGAMGQVTGLKRLCSISEIWKAVVGTDYPQASVFAKATLSSEQIDTFLNKLEASITYLNASADNALELGTYMQNRGDSTLKGAVVKNAYLKMNQRFVLASECKQEIINFIGVLGVNYNAETDSGVFYEKVNN